jgi:hypothetical protein
MQDNLRFGEKSMMNSFKAIPWSRILRAVIWTAIWCGAFALVFMMSMSLAANQPVIFGIIMIAAIVGSVSLAHARINWHHGAWGSAMAALMVGVVGIGVHSALEGSFWSSVIDQINDEVRQEKAMIDARDLVANNRKQRYANSSVGKSVAQIQAEIEAKELDPAIARSKQCADITRIDSRKSCQELANLKVALAAAREAGNLESVVWGAGTTVEAQIKRNLGAVAVLASRLTGGSAEQWTGIIVTGLVVLIQLILAFAFVIGYAPDKRQRKPQEARKVEPVRNADELPKAAPRPDLARRNAHLVEAIEKIAAREAAILRDVKAQMEAAEKIAAREAAILRDVKAQMEAAIKPTVKPDLTVAPSSSWPHENDPDPNGGKPMAPPHLVVDNDADEAKLTTKAEIRERQAERKKPKGHKPQGNVRTWLKERTLYDDADTTVLPSGDLYEDYHKWCGSDLQPLGRKHFTRKIKAEKRLERTFGKLKRTAGGQTLVPGLKLKDASVGRWQIEKKRAVA